MGSEPMTEPIVIRLPGEPHAQGRGRAGVVFGKGGKPVMVNGRPIVRVHDPVESRNWKAAAADHFLQAMSGRSPLTGGVAVEIEAVFTCPRSAWKKCSMTPRRWKLGKPDLENVAKAVLDAGSGICYIDDRQVVELRLRKLVGAQGEAPYVLVRIEELPELVASAANLHRPARELAGASVHSEGSLFGTVEGDA